MKDESKIDEEKMARVIAEARKNPYWREVYDTAPSEGCKRDIALSFYYSESCNEPFEINLADIKQERSRLEASYTIADWKHLSKHYDNNPLHSYYYGKVKELEALENGAKMSNKQKTTSIKDFIELLADPSIQPEDGKFFENMYADLDSVQSKNLTLYLNKMLELEPKILLLGEAPGYHGCGKTGIPFTDEDHLYTEPNYSGFGKHIGAGKKYSDQHENLPEPLEKETSATIIWEALDGWPTPPLMWNSFPYHPYKDGNKKTNRTPTAKEVAFGWKYVETLLSLFSISSENIYCVGRTAQKAIKASDAHYIRHPSYGGKDACTNALATLAKI